MEKEEEAGDIGKLPETGGGGEGEKEGGTKWVEGR